MDCFFLRVRGLLARFFAARHKPPLFFKNPAREIASAEAPASFFYGYS